MLWRCACASCAPSQGDDLNLCAANAAGAASDRGGAMPPSQHGQSNDFTSQPTGSAHQLLLLGQERSRHVSSPRRGPPTPSRSCRHRVSPVDVDQKLNTWSDLNRRQQKVFISTPGCQLQALNMQTAGCSSSDIESSQCRCRDSHEGRHCRCSARTATRAYVERTQRRRSAPPLDWPL